MRVARVVRRTWPPSEAMGLAKRVQTTTEPDVSNMRDVLCMKAAFTEAQRRTMSSICW